jgi:autotransporter-associated beta strand protein
MKRTPSPFRTTSVVVAALGMAVCRFGTSSTLAAVDTWTGGGAPDGNWQTANNWDLGTPVANDQLIFTGATQPLTTNNFPAGTLFNNLTFDGSADLFTVRGNAVTIPTPAAANYIGGLTAAYSGGSISNASANLQAINLPLTLANGHHYLVGNGGGGSLNLAGPITLGSAASVSFTPGINVTGSGLATVNGILGGWATMIPPTSWATLDGGGNIVAYTAFTDITSGTAIANAAASNVRITDSGTPNTLAAATLTDINTLLFAGGAANQVVDVAAGKILRLGAKGAILNASREVGTSRLLTIGTATGVGSVTAGGADGTPGDLYLIDTPFIGNTGNQLVMNSRITNNGTATVTVHTFGHVSYPNVTHAYSGGTYIHGGRVQTQPGILGTGPIVVYPGGQLFFNANGTCTNAVFIAGLGNAEASGNGAIRMGGTSRIITGVVTLTADASTANGTINGRITGPGGLIVGSGTANGVGTLIIGGTNDYAGDTTINGPTATQPSTLQMTVGRPHVMPHGAGKGNVLLNGASATPVVATFNLNATDQTINGLNSTGVTANAVITSSTAGSAILTVGDGNASGSYGGIIQNGSGLVGLTKIGSGVQMISGTSTYSNATTVSSGTLVFGAGSFPVNTSSLTVNSNATLNVSDVGALTFTGSQSLTTSNGTIALALQSAGNAITTPTLNANGATNFITINSIPTVSGYPAQFVAIKYTALNGGLNFGLAGALPVSPGTPFTGYISNNVANGSVDFVVTAGPTSIKWSGYSGGSPNSTWDIGTPNWVTLGGAPTTYSDGVFAQFTDSASNSLVNLSQTLTPAGVTVNNSVLTYTFTGANLTGSASLIKQGSGKLILDNSSANDFSGGILISGGTLQVGSNDFSGNLPETGSIVDNAALAFTRNDSVTVPNLISGTGTLTQNGEGTLILNAANSFSGAVSVLKGTLQTGNNSALGTTNGGTTVASGATLDVGANAINLGQESITISGSGVAGGGALINSAALAGFVGPNAARVTLAGDTTVGGSGRFDLRSNPTANPLLGSLSTLSLPRKLTKVGTGTFGLIGITVDPQLGDVEVQQGIFSLEAAVTGLGNVASNLTIWPGATLQMFAVTNQVNKVISMGSDGTAFSVSATSGANTIIGPMTLTNDCIFNVGGAAVSLALNNVIAGPGLITKVGAGSLSFGGNSPVYGGGLLVNNGNVAVNGTLNNVRGVTVTLGKFALNGTLLGAGGLTNASGSTIVGSGTNAGPVDVSGFLNPGDTNLVGTLTLGALALQGGASLIYDLGSVNTAGGGVNDLIVVNGDLTVNGNAITINPLGLLQTGAGTPYRLFNYTGNLIWNGDLTVAGPNNYTFVVETNTPGQINLVASGGPPVWNGGSATVNNWSDPANWAGVTIASSDTLYFSGNNRLNNTNDTAPGTIYTDLAFNTGAGAFVLNGNPIALAGNVINNSASTETIKLGLTFDTSRTFNGASGPLIIGGGVTNAANATTLTLAGTGTLTNLLGSADPNSMTNIISVTSNANWTLMDNSSATPISTPVQLDVLAGTFSFGLGASAPNLSSTAAANNSRIGVTPNAPATFNMVNGTVTFPARLNTGAGGNTIAVINQTGGTINVRDLVQISDSAATAHTTINVSGGNLNAMDADGNLRNFFLASRGTGVVTVANSGVINCAVLDISRNAAGNTLGSVGVVNLNGGVLAATRVGAATSAVQAGGTPTATFNFNGGTLKARASSATFYQGNASAPVLPIVSIVKIGGAIIDTTNFNISILEPLQHDSTLGGGADGGLTKNGTGTLTLGANNTYTGLTVVNNGTLLVNGSVAGAAVVKTNATLGGISTIAGPVTVESGGTLSPGLAIGTLTLGSSPSLGGTVLAEINRNGGTPLADKVVVNAAVAYNGILVLTNIGAPLVVGDTFTLFNASSYSGSFAIVSQTPDQNVTWNTANLAVNGTIQVASAVSTGVSTIPTNITTVVTGNQLNLSWPADHIGWRLQVQTNGLNVGLGTNWLDVPGSTAVDNVNMTISPANGAVFFRMVYP